MQPGNPAESHAAESPGPQSQQPQPPSQTGRTLPPFSALLAPPPEIPLRPSGERETPRPSAEALFPAPSSGSPPFATTHPPPKFSLAPLPSVSDAASCASALPPAAQIFGFRTLPPLPGVVLPPQQRLLFDSAHVAAAAATLPQPMLSSGASKHEHVRGAAAAAPAVAGLLGHPQHLSLQSLQPPPAKSRRRRYNASRLVRFGLIHEDGRVVLAPSLTWFCATYHISKGKISDMNTGACRHHMRWRMVNDHAVLRRILAKPEDWRLIAGEYRVSPAAIVAVIGPI